ncbi:MAG: prepilin-type N-terminal cleavage/methylation domain-containing protein [Planctomycetota bacterium]
MRRSSVPHRPDKRSRFGFTLIELLIVVGLLLLLAGMTVSAINITVDGDKVRSGARQVQSYLEGARDRAIFSKEPRGVRFLLDPTNNRTVSSLVFIGPTDNWSDGTIQLERLDIDSDNTGAPDYNPDGIADSLGSLPFVVRAFDRNSTSCPTTPYSNSPSEWVSLYRRGLLTNGARIRIPRDSGTWYTVQTDLLKYADALDTTNYRGCSYPPRLRLTVAYNGGEPRNPNQSAVAYFNPGSGPQTYELELPPTVLPNQEPILMPKGVVIHLDRCSDNVEQQPNATTAAGSRGNKLPSGWMITGAPFAISANSGFVYSTQMDVLFSPRGVVIGPAAQRGLIQFYICDQKDADRDHLEWASPVFYANGPSPATTVSVPEYLPRTTGPNDGLKRGDKIITTLFTRTGAISTHQVHPDSDLTNPSYTSSSTPALREYERFKFAETGEVAGK